MKRAKVNPIRAIEVLIKSTFRAAATVAAARLAIVSQREGALNKNKDELVSPRHPFIHMPLTHLKGVQSIKSALFLLVIPISHCSFLTFYGVKSDDDWPPPFHSLRQEVCYIASVLCEYHVQKGS